MICREIVDNAAGLASLPDGDVERGAAYAHAQQCHRCAAALSEGEDVLALLDELPPPPPPSPELLRRVAAQISADLTRVARIVPTAPASAPAPASTRAWGRARSLGVPALLVLLGFVVLALRLHRHLSPEIWAQSLALVTVAAIGGALAATLRSGWVPFGLVALSIFSGLVWNQTNGVGTDECTERQLYAAVIALVPGALLVATGRLRGGGVTLASIAAAGALAGHAGLDLLCRGRAMFPHVIIFHSGFVLFAAVFGWLLGQLPGLRGAARS
jgi:hypothetical protein